ncbi:MAG TPA: UbiA family prenyltransferase [Nevskiaceae bacterium]|nr:UbiA family prenyltransferase [Nevskiaceae bacterium]
MAGVSAEPVLCVDLDGTLIHTDLLYESVLTLLRQSPLSILKLPLWLLRGRAHFKQQVALRVQPDAANLPYNDALVAELKRERSRGRRMVLVTGSPTAFAQQVAEKLGLFDEVLATDEAVNLTGRRKAERLVQRFGVRGYDYAGDSYADVPVWSQAREGWTVDAPAMALKVATGARFTHRFDRPRASPLLYLKAIRVHQWLKNLLVFVPLLAAHLAGQVSLLADAALMFVAFSLCASSGYVLNDLFDLAADRAHPRKRKRPFASGALPLTHGIVMVPALLATAMAIVGLQLGLLALAVLVTYYFGTLAYSLFLKQRAIVDVITLAGLYTLRIIAGSAATLIWPSFWLLAFSMFLFFSLAVVKRYSEVLSVQARGEAQLHSRGYRTEDRLVLSVMGVASGFMAVLVLALYVQSGPVRSLYHYPALVSLLCPLMLYWICRTWFKAHRGEMHDDPLVFAATDRISLVVAALFALILIVAT